MNQKFKAVEYILVNINQTWALMKIKKVGKGLKKLKVSNLKNPLQYDGTKGSKLIQIETQIKNLALNSLTYTGFLEFNLENCGKAFIKAFSSNMIEFSVFDSKGSDGLYTVQGQKAVL